LNDEKALTKPNTGGEERKGTFKGGISIESNKSARAERYRQIKAISLRCGLKSIMAQTAPNGLGMVAHREKRVAHGAKLGEGRVAGNLKNEVLLLKES